MLARYMMFMFIGTILAASPALRAQPTPAQPKQDKILSIGDTIYLAVDLQGALSPYLQQLERRGNPAARPALYVILKDPASQSCWPAVIRMLGYVGDGADGQKLVTFLKHLGKNQDNTVSAALSALAMLHQRKQPGADDLLDQVVRPAFWQQVHFQPTTMPAPAQGRLPFNLDMSRLAIANLAQVDRPYAQAKAAEIQASIENAAEKKLYGQFMDALFHESRRE